MTERQQVSAALFFDKVDTVEQLGGVDAATGQGAAQQAIRSMFRESSRVHHNLQIEKEA